MMPKDFWLLLAIVSGCVLCLLALILARTITENNKMYYDIASKCIEHGGVWTDKTYQCIRK